jgi:hypothetical protein
VQRVRITPGLVEVFGGQHSDSLATALGQKVEWRNNWGQRVPIATSRDGAPSD